MAGTAVGNLDSAWAPVVDDRGRVAAGGSWLLDWWVGAEDRWHLPSREVAVRQRLVDDTPVVETAMRVPGGDIVHRAYGTRWAGTEVVAVEIENRTAVPVALALAVLPGDVRRITQEAGGARVDGTPALLWGKPPSRSAGVDGDVEALVTGGRATEGMVDVRSRKGRASAGFVWPLAHRQTLRFVVPAAGADVGAPGEVPTAEQVVRGWKVHGDRGVRVVLPDPRAQSAFDAGRLLALLEHTRTAEPLVAGALDRLGLAGEAATVLRRLADERPGDVVAPAAFHCLLHADVELAEALAPVVAAEAERDRSLAAAAGAVLRCAGEARAADDAERLAGEPPVQGPDVQSLVARRDALLGAPPGAEVVTVLRDLLVVEDGGGLSLCSHWPSGWLGGGLEVHDAPTAHGTLSFAVRWHGERPALLWELDGSARLRAPGLDPAWSSTEPRGEALLAPVPLPGVPVTLRRG